MPFFSIVTTPITDSAFDQGDYWGMENGKQKMVFLLIWLIGEARVENW